jgi:hypothetical protein
MLIFGNFITKRKAMNHQADQESIAETSSATSGRVDALAAAVFGILELSRNIPELSIAIRENMALQYARLAAGSEDPQYNQAFEDTRAEILRVLR